MAALSALADLLRQVLKDRWHHRTLRFRAHPYPFRQFPANLSGGLSSGPITSGVEKVLAFVGAEEITNMADLFPEGV